MGNGKLNFGKQSGGVLSISFPDGVTNTEVVLPESGNIATKEETVDVYNSHIAVDKPYHLLQGNLAVDNFVTTQGFNTTLYTGNGTTQSINTGIDMATQWGNDVNETFGGLVWLKSRSAATNNFLFDTIRGALNEINSNTTEAQASLANSLTTFDNSGFSLGSAAGINVSSATYASWNFQTTHRVTGTTNHGKAYTCHYNPFTGFTIIKYEGSGIAGHEIPHHLGRKLGFRVIKALTQSDEPWAVKYNGIATEDSYLRLNEATAIQTSTSIVTVDEDNYVNLKSSTATLDATNASNNSYIMYGWANSYFDESNKLIGNYEIGVYQGTGASGNKVTTRGKPAWVMIKRLDSTANWVILDNMRGNSNNVLYLNLNNAEGITTGYGIDLLSDGFTIDNGAGVADIHWNTASGQYLYMVVYDTNSNGGGSYYPKTTDNANVQINNALIPLAKGVDSNGVKNDIIIANETITGVTYSEGKNYLYKTDSGYGKSTIAPSYGTTNPLLGDFFNILENKWYDNTNTEITESRNYMNHIVHADSQGNPLFVEELPKTEYKDEIKANEFKGKNACTAWVNFDGTTTPPTIRDSYNVSAVIRTGTGVFDVYFEEEMDNTDFSFSFGDNYPGFGHTTLVSKMVSKVSCMMLGQTGAGTNVSEISVTIDGGKN